MILVNYAFIAVLIVGAIVFGLAPLLVVALIAPKKKSRTKGDIYECGIRTMGETWVRFRMQYYLFALLFVVFDVETAFLYPWAVAYGRLGLFALVEMAIFVTLLAAALGYAWARGALRWS